MTRSRKTVVIGILTTLLTITASTSIAEEPTADAADKKSWTSPHFSPKVGNLYFLGGAGFFDLDDLNSSLDANGYSELKTPALSLGLGLDVSIGRLILGSEWQWMKNIGSDAERDSLRADIKSKYWLARIGVDVVKWRGLRVYPLFGIGMGTTSVFIAREEGASFREVLDTPSREVRMSQKGLLLDASLGVDYRFKMRETEYKSSFFTVGVRGGYLFSPYSRNWETATAEITGGPDILTTGPTVQLLIGISGERKHWHTRCNCK
jgi:opacity protein-like surface antigen